MCSGALGLNAVDAASEPKQSKRSIPETPLPSTARCRSPHAGGQPSAMGSLQRSSSLGRAGESSLQTAARALQRRERAEAQELALRPAPAQEPVGPRRDPEAALLDLIIRNRQRRRAAAAVEGEEAPPAHGGRGLARQVLVREGLEEDALIKRDEALPRASWRSAT